MPVSCTPSRSTCVPAQAGWQPQSLPCLRPTLSQGEDSGEPRARARGVSCWLDSTVHGLFVWPASAVVAQQQASVADCPAARCSPFNQPPPTNFRPPSLPATAMACCPTCCPSWRRSCLWAPSSRESRWHGSHACARRMPCLIQQADAHRPSPPSPLAAPPPLCSALFGCLVYPATGLNPKPKRFANFLGVLVLEAVSAQVGRGRGGCCATAGGVSREVQGLSAASLAAVGHSVQA